MFINEKDGTGTFCPQCLIAYTFWRGKLWRRLFGTDKFWHRYLLVSRQFCAEMFWRHIIIFTVTELMLFRIELSHSLRYMHVTFSLLLYCLSSYIVYFSVGIYFLFLLLLNIALHITFSMQDWEKVVRTFSCPYSVEINSLWVTRNYIVAPNGDYEQWRNMN